MSRPNFEGEIKIYPGVAKNIMLIDNGYFDKYGVLQWKAFGHIRKWDYLEIYKKKDNFPKKAIMIAYSHGAVYVIEIGGAISWLPGDTIITVEDVTVRCQT